MNFKTIAFSLAIIAGASFTADAQTDYHRDQKAQEAMIKRAYRRGRVTRNEYRKLMQEQDIIRETIWRASRDGVVTLREQNKIDAKLDRAANRLDRYKRNWER